MNKPTKLERKKIYQEALSEFTEYNSDGLCFILGDKLFNKSFYPWTKTQDLMEEFDCFAEKGTWSFGSTTDRESNERRFLCLAMCIEMCNG